MLKSPLFGITEEQLFELAWNRKGSLRASLRSRADDEFFAAVTHALDDLAKSAREKSPFAFFAHVLGPLHGRRKFLARLGPEANDALDEFLNLALDYEARETPRCRASSPGCAPRRAKSSATWRWRATRCA